MKKIILLSLLFSSIAQSQTNGTTEQTSSKIKVYSPSSSTSTTANSSNSYKWTVKTDLFSFVSGEFPVIGEYRVLKNMSVEASAGLTYGLYDNFGIFEEEYDGEGSTFETKASMGNSFRAGIKFYPSSDYDAIEGWAFGIQFFSRTNNREYSSDNYSENEYNFGGEKDSRNKTGLALTISKQVFTDSNISFEWILGIGFAKVKHEFFTENFEESDSEPNYFLKSNTTKETIPNFQLGCRIGFGN
ncbi:hypothetical protein [Flavobacterium sp.]|uniref:hypothetical protein n=1 Tax=Flavobacterium sp. TaxID=239 RepID=UPI003266D88D